MLLTPIPDGSIILRAGRQPVRPSHHPKFAPPMLICGVPPDTEDSSEIVFRSLTEEETVSLCLSSIRRSDMFDSPSSSKRTLGMKEKKRNQNSNTHSKSQGRDDDALGKKKKQKP